MMAFFEGILAPLTNEEGTDDPLQCYEIQSKKKSESDVRLEKLIERFLVDGEFGRPN